MKVETVLLGESEQFGGRAYGTAALKRYAEQARRIEELGFDGLNTPEMGNDPFLPLVVVAEHTRRLYLATHVAIAFPRSPMVTAQMAWDLQRFSGGRFQLGLGTQVKGHNERRYSVPWTAPPGPRMREYVQCLRAIFQTFQNGARPTFFTGKYYQFTLMSPFFNPGPLQHSHIPIYIAGLNRYMGRLAGELCDGLRLHPMVTRRFTESVIVPALEEGARRAGRQVSEIDVVGTPFIITGKDRAEVEAAKANIRMRIAFYASTRTYHSVLSQHGWAELGMRLHHLSLEGRWQEMGGLISDEMLEEFAIVGTYDEVVPRLKERWGDVYTTVMLGLPFDTSERAEQVRRLIQALHEG